MGNLITTTEKIPGSVHPNRNIYPLNNSLLAKAVYEAVINYHQDASESTTGFAGGHTYIKRACCLSQSDASNQNYYIFLKVINHQDQWDSGKPTYTNVAIPIPKSMCNSDKTGGQNYVDDPEVAGAKNDRCDQFYTSYCNDKFWEYKDLNSLSSHYMISDCSCMNSIYRQVNQGKFSDVANKVLSSKVRAESTRVSPAVYALNADKRCNAYTNQGVINKPFIEAAHRGQSVAINICTSDINLSNIDVGEIEGDIVASIEDIDVSQNCGGSPPDTGVNNEVTAQQEKEAADKKAREEAAAAAAAEEARKKAEAEAAAKKAAEEEAARKAAAEAAAAEAAAAAAAAASAAEKAAAEQAAAEAAAAAAKAEADRQAAAESAAKAEQERLQKAAAEEAQRLAASAAAKEAAAKEAAAAAAAAQAAGNAAEAERLQQEAAMREKEAQDLTDAAAAAEQTATQMENAAATGTGSSGSTTTATGSTATGTGGDGLSLTSTATTPEAGSEENVSIIVKLQQNPKMAAGIVAVIVLLLIGLMMMLRGGKKSGGMSPPMGPTSYGAPAGYGQYGGVISSAYHLPRV